MDSASVDDMIRSHWHIAERMAARYARMFPSLDQEFLSAATVALWRVAASDGVRDFARSAFSCMRRAIVDILKKEVGLSDDGRRAVKLKLRHVVRFDDEFRDDMVADHRGNGIDREEFALALNWIGELRPIHREALEAFYLRVPKANAPKLDHGDPREVRERRLRREAVALCRERAARLGVAG